MEANVMEALAAALAPHMKDAQYKVTASGTASTPYSHGPGGLFGVAGLERDVIHTRVRGNGVASMLPTSGSVFTDPMFPYISGFQDVSGTVPATPCDDPEEAGSMKTCIQTAPFGRYSFMTRESEVNRIGQLINRGEFNDLSVQNDPIAPQLGKSIFPNMSGNSQIKAGAEVLNRMLEVGVAFMNRLGRQLYTGNPTNNNVGGGSKEFMGLDLLIGTTKVDAITNTDCPSLRSDVKDFNYDKVDDANAQESIVRVLTTLWRFINHVASQTGLNPATWALSMRTSLFWEITDVWPCAYNTYRCTLHLGASDENIVNGTEMVRMRDEMRNGKYLMIDGVRVPVILDDNIVEESSGDTNRVDIGCFASDIYLIPLTYLGGRPATFWEFFDYRQGTMQAVTNGRATNWFWTDGGMYLWTLDTQNWCLVHEAKIEPRIILKTPQIAGRLTNVQYCPLQHPRDPQPGDDYFVDGGVTDRDPPSLYSDWNSA